ncbi:hypothetical protein BP6252_02142 [Coleophoma cylindrospora]|uniref:Uncharacterized protein n=1 Tax=Coleophoma cylindrospora TaxID=1849047 RepID=A0A3D8SE15_9HELO|nr:hypothetical protein BP6252_02142 [Coleophoma cylindrospora]
MNLDGVGGARQAGVHSAESKQVYLNNEKRLRANWGIEQDQPWESKFPIEIRPGYGDNKRLGLTALTFLSQISSLVSCDEGVRLMIDECRDEKGRPMGMGWKHTKTVAAALKESTQNTQTTTPKESRRRTKSLDVDEPVATRAADQGPRKAAKDLPWKPIKPSSTLSAMEPNEITGRGEMSSSVRTPLPISFNTPLAPMSTPTSPPSTSDKATGYSASRRRAVTRTLRFPKISPKSAKNPPSHSIVIARESPTSSLRQTENNDKAVTTSKKRDPLTRPAELLSSEHPTKRIRIDTIINQASQSPKSTSISSTEAAPEVQDSSAFPEAPIHAVPPLQEVSAASPHIDTDHQSPFSMSSSSSNSPVALSSPTSSVSPSIEASIIETSPSIEVEPFGIQELGERATIWSPKSQINENQTVEAKPSKTVTAATTRPLPHLMTNAKNIGTLASNFQPVEDDTTQSDVWEKQAAVVREQLKDLDKRKPMRAWPGAIREPVPGQPIQSYGFYRNTATMQQCWLQLKENERMKELRLQDSVEVNGALNLARSLEMWCYGRMKDYEELFGGKKLKAITHPADGEKLEQVQELMSKVGKQLKDGIEGIFKT